MAGLASEEALAALTSELLTSAAALDDAALEGLGSELAAVADVVSGEPAARRLLTDPTTDAGARAGLALRLFEGRVAAGTLGILISAVKQRWSSGRDLVDGLVRLSRTAIFVRAERAGELDDVEDQLFRFGRIVDGNPELSLIMDDPAGTVAGKIDLVGRLLAGKANRLTIELLGSVARTATGRSFGYELSELVAQAAARRDKLVAVATSAIALSTEETDRLRAALGAIYSRQVAVHVVVDPALRGGLRVRVGDEVIDGSMSGRLVDIRQRLSRR